MDSSELQPTWDSLDQEERVTYVVHALASGEAVTALTERLRVPFEEFLNLVNSPAYIALETAVSAKMASFASRRLKIAQMANIMEFGRGGKADTKLHQILHDINGPINLVENDSDEPPLGEDVMHNIDVITELHGWKIALITSQTN